MPRVHDDNLDCAIYLYPSVHEARSGESTGGSGFLVGVESEVHSGRGHIYAATNSHVIREGNSPVVRLNTQHGDTDIVDIDPSAWVHHPDGDDVAVCQLQSLVPGKHRFSHVPRSMFVTRAFASEVRLGPGDDVFLVGRFISHDGKQRNLPVARFGNIAMMPLEPIEHPTRGIKQESFLVDLRSISGHSGSPVFVEIVGYLKRDGVPDVDDKKGIRLLGLDWCHLPARSEPVREKGGARIQEEWGVKTNSGMAGVIPAWRLDELLMTPELVEARRRLDLQRSK